ncbi:MAG TPA: DUF4139 domain-containing protein [Polyangiaceae bacterium]|nr:DUF4139 domain-containing protein [Polyangiaceae bacterium]
MLNKVAVARYGLLVGLMTACCGFLAGCQAPAKAPRRGPAQARQSDQRDRRAVAVTVYNQDFGVVRESRHLKLAPGLVELSFKDVASAIEPETVRLHSLSKGALFDVLEQNYRYDLLTPAKLLEKYVGKSIALYRYNQKTGVEEKKTAEVLSVEGGVTLRIDGEVTTLSGELGQGLRFGFADVPPNLLEKPTLVWLLDSDRAEQDVEVTYVTSGMSWSADYVLKLGASDTEADLNGWVTLTNNSGTSYEKAQLCLVAGNVNRKDPNAPRDLGALDDTPAPEKPQFKEEGLFEYHQYTLERPTTLLDKETKQVSLLSAEAVRVRKKLVFNGQPYFYRGQYGQLAQDQKVGVLVELENSEQNHLGMPLPKGTVRLYKADASGALQFVGEDAVDHTPRDEKLSLKVGEAFDVVGDRKQTNWVALGSCSSESSYEIELRNHKDAEVTVEVNEPAGGDWQVLESSTPFVKVDAQSFRFDVEVPARGATKLTYRVRVRYC